MTDSKEGTIRELLAQVSNRLSAAHEADAQDWLDYGEWGLAIDAIADGLYEAVPALNAQERESFAKFVKSVGRSPAEFGYLGLDA